MIKLYAGAGLAMKNGAASLVAMSYVARNENEARGAFYNYMTTQYPSSDGFSNHSVITVAVHDEKINRVVNQETGDD